MGTKAVDQAMQFYEAAGRCGSRLGEHELQLGHEAVKLLTDYTEFSSKQMCTLQNEVSAAHRLRDMYALQAQMFKGAITFGRSEC